MPGLDWRVIFARVKTSTGSYVCALKRKLVVELPGILQVGENVAISPFTLHVAQSEIAEVLILCL